MVMHPDNYPCAKCGEDFYANLSSHDQLYIECLEKDRDERIQEVEDLKKCIHVLEESGKRSAVTINRLFDENVLLDATLDAAVEMLKEFADESNWMWGETDCGYRYIDWIGENNAKDRAKKVIAAWEELKNESD